MLEYEKYASKNLRKIIFGSDTFLLLTYLKLCWTQWQVRGSVISLFVNLVNLCYQPKIP